MRYIVKKKMIGGLTVFYTCERCLAPLESPLEEAGTAQMCPTCKGAFVTPGETELREAKRSEEEATKALQVNSCQRPIVWKYVRPLRRGPRLPRSLSGTARCDATTAVTIGKRAGKRRRGNARIVRIGTSKR